MRHSRINSHLKGHNSVPRIPRRFELARLAGFFRAVLFGVLRGLAAGFLRRSATKGGFVPRLPVILLTYILHRYRRLLLT